MLSRVLPSSWTASATQITSPLSAHKTFVPDYVLDAQLKHAERIGDTKMADSVRRTLEVDKQFRELRLRSSEVSDDKNPPINAGGYEPGTDPKKTEYFVYSADSRRLLPGQVIFKAGSDRENPVDKDAPAVYDFMDNFAGFLKYIGDINSIDNRFYDLHFTIHYGVNYNNAFWNNRQMVTGDGDGKIFTNFHLDPDVNGHEIFHGVTHFIAGSEAFKDEDNISHYIQHKDGFIQAVARNGLIFGGLEYWGESGALNESYSDIFALLDRMRKEGKTVKDMTYDDWLLGAKAMVGDNIDGTKSAIRNFDNKPGYNRRDIGKDPQPKHYKDKYRGGGDNGGVHYNSGIINHAFFKAAHKLADFEGGDLNKSLGPVWFETLKHLHSRADFKDFAIEVHKASAKLFGESHEVTKAIDESLYEVGVTRSPVVHAWWALSQAGAKLFESVFG